MRWRVAGISALSHLMALTPCFVAGRSARAPRFTPEIAVCLPPLPETPFIADPPPAPIPEPMPQPLADIPPPWEPPPPREVANPAFDLAALSTIPPAPPESVPMEIEDPQTEALESPDVSEALRADAADAAEEYWARARAAIAARLRYPAAALSTGIEGLVWVDLTLDETGGIAALEVAEDAPRALAREAIRAIRAAAPFEAPGEGIPRRARLPLRFARRG